MIEWLFGKIRTRANLLCVVSGLFVGLLIISNILTAKQFEIEGIVLTCGVLVFPLVYILNDMLVEVYGYEVTKRIIILGFSVQLIAVLAYHLAILLPTPVFNQECSDAFSTVLGTSGRILCASFVAYLIGSFLNAKVMVWLKKKFHSQLLLRCMTSTLVGEGVDSALFLTVAFLGIMPSAELLILIICEALFKVVLEVVIYPVTRSTIRCAQKLKD